MCIETPLPGTSPKLRWSGMRSNLRRLINESTDQRTCRSYGAWPASIATSYKHGAPNGALPES